MILWMMAQNATAQDVLRVETYNVGLAHGFVEMAADRLPAISANLGEQQSDVLCLQEAWEPGDRAEIMRSMQDTYPHSYMQPVEQLYAEDAPACKRKELFGEDRFVSCMTSACDGKEGDELTDCIVSECGPILRDLRDESPQCATAVMAQVGKPALRAIWTVVRPIRRSNLFAYGGSDGLMMLSRYPLNNTGELNFTDIATLNRRRALHAEISVDGQDVRVYCTHLTAMLDGQAPYPGAFDSWADENLAQVDRLLEHAAEHDGPVVIAGDLNTGPEQQEPRLDPEMPDSHQRIVDAGYDDPALLLGVCTYCGDNSLNEPDAGLKLIDHIYVQGIDARDGARTRDAIATLSDGTQSHLSDHFGYAVTLYFAPPEPDPEPEPEPEDAAAPAE